MEQFRKEVCDFSELMGDDLLYLSLAEILNLFQQYLRACNLPEDEKKIIFAEIKNLEIIDQEEEKQFIGLFE